LSCLFFSFQNKYIGNPQAVGQRPITYFRQVLALTDLGDYGLDHPEVNTMFPVDVVKRARNIREILAGSGTGAYTGSQGALGFRKDVAEFLEKRDGHPACE
jgi:aspartate/methionine/tyrosine aminotransferase